MWDHHQRSSIIPKYQPDRQRCIHTKNSANLAHIFILKKRTFQNKFSENTALIRMDKEKKLLLSVQMKWNNDASCIFPE